MSIENGSEAPVATYAIAIGTPTDGEGPPLVTTPTTSGAPARSPPETTG
jgi:hypothetical protein